MTGTFALQFTLAAAATAGLLAGLHVAVRRRWPAWVYLLPVLLPIAGLAVLTDWRLVSHHGFMHASFTYQILERGAPPENPLLAGEPLRYPYAQHWAAAWTIRLVPISPQTFLLIVNALAAVLMVVLIDRCAARLHRGRSFRVIAVTLALVGTSPFVQGPALLLMRKLGLGTEARLPAYSKFLVPETNAWGLALYALTLWGFVQIAGTSARSQARRMGYAATLLGLLGVGLLYPMDWLPAAGLAAAMAAFWALGDGAPGTDRRRAVMMGLILGITTLVVAWSLRGTAAGKGARASLHLIDSIGEIRRALTVLAGALAMPLLAWLLAGILPRWLAAPRGDATRPEIPVSAPAQTFGPPPDGMTSEVAPAVAIVPANVRPVLLAAALVGMALFAAVSAPMQTQYKFLAAGSLAIALLAATAVDRLYRCRPWMAGLLLFPVVFPVFWMLIGPAVAWPVTMRAFEQGSSLWPVDAGERALCGWVRSNTPADAVLLDTRLSMPVFARRPLFVGLDTDEEERASAALGAMVHTGWGMTPTMLLEEVAGADANRLAQRRRLVQQVYGASLREGGVRVPLLAGAPAFALAASPGVGTGESLGLPTATDLRASVGGRPVYVVARSEQARARLRDQEDFTLVYSSPAADVYVAAPHQAAEPSPTARAAASDSR